MQPDQPNKLRKVNVIEYAESTRRANLNTKKGQQMQTASLNINLKSINKNQLLKMSILSAQQKNIIADYLINKANFSTTRKLFGVQHSPYSQISHQNILKCMQSFYKNTRFIHKILQNENMDFNNKLILLKFAEKIRVSAVYPKKHTNWKDKF